MLIDLPIKSNKLNEKELIKLFCNYVTSNKNFKYNLSYLTDMIDVFMEKIDILNKKHESFQNILNTLNINNNNKWYIVFDDTFIASNDKNIYFIVDFIEDNKNDYQSKLMSYKEKFNFYELKETPFIVNILSKKDNIDERCACTLKNSNVEHIQEVIKSRLDLHF